MKSKFPKMQWKVSKYRRDQRSGVINPVKPSDYYKYLAGVIDSEQKPNRASSKGLQLDDQRNQETTRFDGLQRR